MLGWLRGPPLSEVQLLLSGRGSINNSVTLVRGRPETIDVLERVRAMQAQLNDAELQVY